MWGTKPMPAPEPDEDEDPEFSQRLQGFVDLGFATFSAFTLAWRGFSPSDVRERLLKHGATHEEALRILL